MKKMSEVESLIEERRGHTHGGWVGSQRERSQENWCVRRKKGEGGRMYFSPIKFSSPFRIANMHLNLIIQLCYIKCQITVTEKHLKLIHMHEINPV